MNKYLFLFLLIILEFTLFSKDFIIFKNNGKIINLDELSNEVNYSCDLIFFGEKHDDPITHKLEWELFKKLIKLDKAWQLSLEMFERDVQDYLNDYLSGKINEEEFLKNARPWPNYKTDYRPLIELAKLNKQFVLASNVPRRYAAMIAKFGENALSNISDDEKKWIAKKSFVLIDKYFINFKRVMSTNMGMMIHKKHKKGMLLNVYRAQCLKDDTMAESIVNYLKSNPDKKLIHYNGSFHSDFYLGTVKRVMIRFLDCKIKTITAIPVNKLPNRLNNSDIKKADYIIYTIIK